MTQGEFDFWSECARAALPAWIAKGNDAATAALFAAQTADEMLQRARELAEHND